jgi:hypothetical protein
MVCAERKWDSKLIQSTFKNYFLSSPLHALHCSPNPGSNLPPRSTFIFSVAFLSNDHGHDNGRCLWKMQRKCHGWPAVASLQGGTVCHISHLPRAWPSHQISEISRSHHKRWRKRPVSPDVPSICGRMSVTRPDVPYCSPLAFLGCFLTRFTRQNTIVFHFPPRRISTSTKSHNIAWAWR